jgi:hypothetical protein
MSESIDLGDYIPDVSGVTHAYHGPHPHLAQLKESDPDAYNRVMYGSHGPPKVPSHSSSSSSNSSMSDDNANRAIARAAKIIFGVGGLGAAYLGNKYLFSDDSDNKKKEKRAYINGFVKRANAHGLSDEDTLGLLKSAISKAEVEESKANMHLNAAFGWTPFGFAGSAYKDLTTPGDMPSKLMHINLPSLAALTLGARLGARFGGEPIDILAGSLIGGTLGGAAGTFTYNHDLEEYLKKKRHWSKS